MSFLAEVNEQRQSDGLCASHSLFVATLIAGMGVITSQVFVGYGKYVSEPTQEQKAKRDASQAAQKQAVECY